jgi:hypothetical protein
LPFVRFINLAVVWIFAIEFALRFWSEGENPAHKGIGGRVRFLMQPVTIADILAFAPELIAMLFFPDVFERTLPSAARASGFSACSSWRATCRRSRSWAQR